MTHPTTQTIQKLYEFTSQASQKATLVLCVFMPPIFPMKYMSYGTIYELQMIGSIIPQHARVPYWDTSNGDCVMLHQEATISHKIKNVIPLTNFFQCTDDIYYLGTICMMMGVQTLAHLDKVSTYFSLVQTLPIMWEAMTFMNAMLHPITASLMYCGTSPATYHSKCRNVLPLWSSPLVFM